MLIPLSYVSSLSVFPAEYGPIEVVLRLHRNMFWLLMPLKMNTSGSFFAYLSTAWEGKPTPEWQTAFC
jgi:hypothetical protein